MAAVEGSAALGIALDEDKKGFRVIQPNINVLSAFAKTIEDTSFDYLEVSYPSVTSEVYELITGGVTGSVAATFTVVYADATKSALTSVLKS